MVMVPGPDLAGSSKGITSCINSSTGLVLPLKITNRDIITDKTIKARAPRAAILSTLPDLREIARKITPANIATPRRIWKNITYTVHL